MSKEIKVVYAVIDAKEWAKNECPRCKGKGEETVWPRVTPQTCPYCGGTGTSPHAPTSYAYRADDSVQVGDIMDCPTMFGAEVGTVVGIGPSDYDGPLHFATRRLR